ncbi:TetR/AcrR family transcriptional regulator [Nonomuraea cavernae]|uniref:TetR family transcriptional regulator n=1 Tax=Nonomuraea cavernae TaxID=2045107 RepID=A0A917YSQ3_9ACTN|nr:TetR/AcrR family transcriptional regulator [Nonomuraea cavernae]MCA2185251.1 TetR/AcrR family transcriptional regulator [Nonomuraea cavernae]GGO65881.1 TetR family transcriptional regulator [Nonomuraea cavernae]
MGQGESGDVDPRVLRTRRDVIDAATQLFREEGWDAMTHAEVARRAGYSKVTVYAHWPTRLDLVRASVGQICDAMEHPEPTGDLRADLISGLTDFAEDLAGGHLDRVLGGVFERSGSDPVVDELRRRLYEAGTRALEDILRSHLPPQDVEPSLALLVGGVIVRGVFQAQPPSRKFVAELVDRVLASAGRREVP